jgi:biopolymer transport protein ExbD
MPRLRRAPAAIEANLTPLIDMSFLLVVFFVLVSRITSSEIVPMNLPAPKDPLSTEPGDEPRAVLNVIAGDDDRDVYQLGNTLFNGDEDGVQLLRERFAALYRATPTMLVNLRADRAAQYDRVAPAMRAIALGAADASAALTVPIPPRVQLVVVRDPLQ